MRIVAERTNEAQNQHGEYPLSGWPGHYNNVGCSARLEISFELNLLLRVNKVTLLYFISNIFIN